MANTFNSHTGSTTFVDQKLGHVESHSKSKEWVWRNLLKISWKEHKINEALLGLEGENEIIWKREKDTLYCK